MVWEPPQPACSGLGWAQVPAGGGAGWAVGDGQWRTRGSCRRTEQRGVFTHKEFEQLAPVLDGFSLMTYDYPTAQQ